MRKILNVLVLACLLSACVTQPSGIDALQGTWVVASGEHEGKLMDVVVGGVLTVSGDSFNIRAASGTQLKGRLQVDAKQRPATLDFMHENGMQWLAIYELQGTTLRLNYVDAAGKEPRPLEFITSSATEASLLTLRR